MLLRLTRFTLAVLALSSGLGAGAVTAAAATKPATTTTTATTAPARTPTAPARTTTTPARTTTTPPPTTTTPPPTTTTPPPPTAAAPPVRARVRMYLAGTFGLHGDLVTVTGRPVQVQGFVTPYVPGQVVAVQASVGTRRFAALRARVAAGPGDRYGRFTITVRSPAPGIVRVQAVHAATAAMLGFFAQRAFAALAPAVGFGSTGRLVQLIQQQLAALHIYIPQSGVYDAQTGLAVDAYHRLLGWGEGNQLVDGRTLNELLNGAGRFTVRFPGDGQHVEGNLSRQLLALINGSSVHAIYPISSGKPSTPTILGRFQVYERVSGYLPDGMYYSSFFYGGYAVHGYDPAPPYPASHGCMRLPIADAISAYDWITYGDWVDVYY